MATAETTAAWSAARGAVLNAATATKSSSVASECLFFPPQCPAAAAATAPDSAEYPAASTSDTVSKGEDSLQQSYFSEAYYKRLLLSFSSAKWFCPPPELSPFLLARNGFRCISVGVIECAVCGVKWTAKCGLHSEIVPAPARIEQAEDSAAVHACSTPAATRAASSVSAGTAVTVNSQNARDYALRAAASISATPAAGAAEAASADARSRRDEGSAAAAGQQPQQRKAGSGQQQGSGFRIFNESPREQEDGALASTAATYKSDGGVSSLIHKRSSGSAAESKKDQEKSGNPVFLDAVSLSFLHGECCPWRNSFIPLGNVRLMGSSLQPAVLVSQWKERMQRLRRAMATGESFPAYYPRITLQGARTFLLCALMAAAEAAAATDARTRAALEEAEGENAEARASAERKAGVATSIASCAPQPAPPADKGSESTVYVESAQEGWNSSTRVDIREGKSDAGNTPYGTSLCKPVLDLSQFFSSSHSPLQDVCLSQLSRKEMQLLRKLWHYLARGGGEVEDGVNRCLSPGAIILPMCASHMLFQKKCELGEKWGDKKADEFLSLPVLETLLHQVLALLFDPRSPVPGDSLAKFSFSNSMCSLAAKTSFTSFEFPKAHEAVQVDCTKLLAFFGWQPLEDVVESEQFRASSLINTGQRRQCDSTAAGGFEPSSEASQRLKKHRLQRPDALQHAARLSPEHREGERNFEQENYVSGSDAFYIESQDGKAQHLARAPVSEMRATKQKSTITLQCQYCFRCVELTHYLLQEGKGHNGDDSTQVDFSYEPAEHFRKSETKEAERARVEKRHGKREEGGNEGTLSVERGTEVIDTEAERDSSLEAACKDDDMEQQVSAAQQTGDMYLLATEASDCGEGCACDSIHLVSGYPRINTDAGGEGGREQRTSPPDQKMEKNSCNGEAYVRSRPTEAGQAITRWAGGTSERKNRRPMVYTGCIPSFDPVSVHRLHCPFVCNAVYSDKLPVILKLFVSLIPALVENLQLQVEKCSLDAEIKQMWTYKRQSRGSEPRGQRGEAPETKYSK